MIHKLVKGILRILGYFIFVICAFWLICNTERLVKFINAEYPTDGEYYLSFSNEEGYAKVSAYYKQEFYNEKMDFSNLKLYVNSNDEYEYDVEDEDDIYDDNKIRIKLLESGLAELIDISEATEDEIVAQKTAIKTENGIWNVDSEGKITMHSVWLNILQFSNSNLGIILIWVIFSFIGINPIIIFVITVAKKIITYMQVDVIPMGEVSSGKTTIIRRFINPYVTPGELLKSGSKSHTKSGKRDRGEKIPCGKKFIHPILYDNRGVDIGKMIDSLNAFSITKSDKRVVIYVLSFTKVNNVKDIGEDNTYQIREITKAKAMLQILKTSSSIKKPIKVIIFFNKCDLVYSTEEEFIHDIGHSKIRNKYRADDLLLISRYSDYCVYGSAVMGWGMSELKNKIANI